MTSQKQAVASQFGRMAGAYASSAGHAKGPDLPILIGFLEPQLSMTVLDVATGAGHTAAAVAPLVNQVIAVDLAPEMLTQTRQLAGKRDLGNIKVALCDAEAVPFRDETFDGVTCRIAPHHFVNFRIAVDEMARVLRRGGRLAIEDSCSPADAVLDDFLHRLEMTRDATHVRSYSEGEWRDALRSVGVEVDRVQVYRKAHPVAEWVARSGVDDETAVSVHDLLVNAPVAAQRYFEISYENGVPMSFTDDKLIIAGQKT